MMVHAASNVSLALRRLRRSRESRGRRRGDRSDGDRAEQSRHADVSLDERLDLRRHREDRRVDLAVFDAR